MTDQSSNEGNNLPPEIDETRSLCWTCKHGLCGMKEGVDHSVTVGDIFVGGGPAGPGGGPGMMGMDTDPALADHHLLFSNNDEKGDEPDEEDEMTQFAIRHFVHAICCHPMLKDRVADMPIVLACNQHEEPTDDTDEE